MNKPGVLFVISTPIGNLDDITVRTLQVFDEIEVLVCEDTRVAGKLLAKYREREWIKSKPRLIAYNDFNERKLWAEIVALVRNGSLVGLISDAGTPTLADPGYRVVRGCLDEGLQVTVIPGPSSITAALPYAGLGGEQFLFAGFLPKKVGKRKKEVEKIAKLINDFPGIKIVLFITPHRVTTDLNSLSEFMSDNKAVLLRELTKHFEERIEGTISELQKIAETKKLKGEMVLVIAGGEN